MKKIAMMTLLFSTLTFVSSAAGDYKMEARSENAQVTSSSQSEESLNNSVLKNETLLNVEQKNGPIKPKHWKDFKDRSLAGKIVLIAGVSVFVVLCVLFGSVSVGG